MATATAGSAYDERATTIAAHVEEFIDELLQAEADMMESAVGTSALVRDLRTVVLSGGKRLRPTFCHWGFVAASGPGADHRGALAAGAALEFLHAFALIHDDVMDGSQTRRGATCLHQRLTQAHLRHTWRGEARRFGEGVAVLAGDLAFALAGRLAAELPAAARLVWSRTCAELMSGQYLDLLGAAEGQRNTAYAHRVALLKSARYTVVRPLQLGSALATTSPERAIALDRVWMRFGDALGQAFQLRDDLLGVFGDPTETGKPVGDDLRHGKPTVLLSLAWADATPAQRCMLERAGDDSLTDANVDGMRDTLEATGARQRVEDLIGQHVQHACASLARADLDPLVEHALRDVALATAWRTH